MSSFPGDLHKAHQHVKQPKHAGYIKGYEDEPQEKRRTPSYDGHQHHVPLSDNGSPAIMALTSSARTIKSTVESMSSSRFVMFLFFERVETTSKRTG
jgi:hypothetical protein